MKPKSGTFILGQLQRFGSHVDRKHEVTFWLYFPTEETARQAARRAEEAGLSPEVSPPLEGQHPPRWLCLLQCPHVRCHGGARGIFCYVRLLDAARAIIEGFFEVDP